MDVYWQVPCVMRSYVVDWVTQPWQTLSAHVLFKSKISGLFKTAQDGRGISPDEAVEPSVDWGAP